MSILLNLPRRLQRKYEILGIELRNQHNNLNLHVVYIFESGIKYIAMICYDCIFSFLPPFTCPSHEKAVSGASAKIG